jgi:hypothetical protein
VQQNGERRAEHPHVMIAAGLNAVPQTGGQYDTLFKIRERAASLSVSSKSIPFAGSPNELMLPCETYGKVTSS